MGECYTLLNVRRNKWACICKALTRVSYHLFSLYLFLLSPIICFFFLYFVKYETHSRGFKFQKYKRAERSKFQAWELECCQFLLSPSSSPRCNPLVSADRTGCRLCSTFRVFSVIVWSLSMFLHSELLHSFFYGHIAFCWVDQSRFITQIPDRWAGSSFPVFRSHAQYCND